MKIVIFGLAKTGTTGLFYQLRRSLRGSVTELFEPMAYTPGIDSNTTHTLAKVLIGLKGLDYASFDEFDKKILILRDPRDRMVSWMLYRIGRPEFYLDDDTALAYLRLLYTKQQHPATVSAAKIQAFPQTFEQAGIRDRTVDLLSDFHDCNPELYPIHYEDFIANRLQGLEAYLGLKLSPDASVASQFQRVVRTKSSDDWRNWFTDHDRHIFQPAFSDFMVRYGYAADWRLNATPHITPQHSYHYALSVANEFRAMRQLAPLDEASIMLMP